MSACRAVCGILSGLALVLPAAGIAQEPGRNAPAPDEVLSLGSEVGEAVRNLTLRRQSFVLIEEKGEARIWILEAHTSHDDDGLDSTDATPTSENRAEAALWREGGVEALSTSLGAREVEILLEASSSPNAEDRASAVAVLAQHGAPVLAILGAAALRDRDAGVRFTALQHLAAGGSDATPHLLRIFRESQDADLRLIALSVIAGMRRQVSEDLLTLAVRDTDAKVRAVAKELATALTSNPSPRSPE